MAEIQMENIIVCRTVIKENSGSKILLDKQMPFDKVILKKGHPIMCLMKTKKFTEKKEDWDRRFIDKKIIEIIKQGDNSLIVETEKSYYTVEKQK